MLDAGDTEVRETGPQPPWALDKSTHKCNTARHLPVEVCARRKQRLGLEHSGESGGKKLPVGGDVEQNLEGIARACQVDTGRR